MVIFITGTGHCGSTLLDLMLGSHSEGFSLGEFHRTTPDLQCRECAVCPFWSAFPKWWLRLHFSRIGKHLDPYPRIFKQSGAKFLVDSSKSTHWISQHKRRGDFLILLDRDPKAVVASYWRRYPERGFESVADRIARQRRQLRQFWEAQDCDKALVQYEDLVQQPEAALQKICSRLRIDFQNQMLNPFDQDHHIIAGNGKTRRMGRGVLDQEVGFYQDTSIRLDERWREELTEAQIRYVECS